MDSGYKYILAYGTAIMIFVFIAKFRAGYNALYYLAVLSLLLLLLTESKFIVSALAPISGPSTQNINNNSIITL